MCSKRNGAASVRCHRAMNWPIPVASTGLWASCEPLKRHVLKIVRPYIFRDVYRFEIPPNRNIVPALETCCDVAVAQINYPSFKHNTQDSIEQARGRSHKEVSSQIFMLYVM